MVFIVFPVLTIMSPPSSRFHSIFGSGYPRALHTNLAEPPSGIIMSPDVSSYTMSGGMTTSRKALCEHKWSFRGQKGKNPKNKYNFLQMKSGRGRENKCMMLLGFSSGPCSLDTCTCPCLLSGRSGRSTSTCCNHCVWPTIVRCW